MTVPRCGDSWKPPLRFPQGFQCRESRWNPQVDYSQVWKLVKTLRGFYKISNEENLCGILRLTVPRCGNSWKPLMRFSKSFQCRERCGILRSTVPRCGHSWKPPVRFPQSFQSRESMWNPRVECSQVWKLVETTSEVSLKCLIQGMYMESSG